MSNQEHDMQRIVHHRSLPQGGRQVIVEVCHLKQDGSRGPLSHFEVRHKLHAGAKTQHHELSPEDARRLFAAFNIRPDVESRVHPVGNGKLVRDTQRHAEHMPQMDYRNKPAKARTRLSGHSRDAFFIAKALASVWGS